MIAARLAECALFAFIGVFTVAAFTLGWDAEERLTDPCYPTPEPIHGPDVVCVCLTTLSPPAWECFGGSRAR